MTPKTSSVDVKKLQRLYTGNAGARAVLDHFASRERNWGVTPVGRIQAILQGGGTAVSRGDVIHVFKALEDAGCGAFKVGRKGWESRFEWTAQMVSVGQAASGESVKVEEVTQDEIIGEESELALRHSFQLRPDAVVTIELPRNLTTTEADRLARFVQSLPFDQQHNRS
jgi:hypothetical protein